MNTPTKNVQQASRGRALLVASTGGHLAQLKRLQGRLNIAPNPLWVTFDHPQADSLLRSERVAQLRYIAPRDYRSILLNAPKMLKLLWAERPDVVVSTGAAVALLALPLARLFGARAIYIESVSRFDGPSLTGRILAKMPTVELYTQHRSWATRKWQLHPSVLQDYRVRVSSTKQSPVIRQIFVTLGTIRPYRFDRVVDRLKEIIPDGVRVVWQLGETVRDDVAGPTFDTISADQLAEYVATSDVIVSHAGVGSALQILDMGKCPVLFAREKSHNEHIDDHQRQIAQELSAMGLAIYKNPESLEWSDIEDASRTIIELDPQVGT